MWSVPTKSHAAITCNLAIRTLAEIKEMPTQSVSFSHSPRSGIANAPTAPGPKPQRPHHPKRKGLNRATVDHRQSEFIVHEAAIVSGIGPLSISRQPIDNQPQGKGLRGRLVPDAVDYRDQRHHGARQCPMVPL